ncbi:3,4-dihydroxyphenylacetaldehyde synthase isoform X2 [Ptiloglossa arizonensis]|uniref:3,4-dihydroxyphenylacetaldehyde synthase isoform X2 n=1 Tax=Ptiloglossa arizonensis TaxID=3350558 RepID=UPI003F9F51D2
MDTKEFIDFGKAAIEFVANYTDTLRDRNVLSDVDPGYLSELLPDKAPKKAETWQEVLNDIERYIMPGITHWNSPNFHAFYPCANSYPALVADILCNGIGCIGFSWFASPACTELEVIMMNWLGKLIGLPNEFLNCSEGPGGGVIQGSASEATLVCLLIAKEQTTRRIKRLHPEWDENFIKNKLISYASDQSNSSVEKAGILASVPMKLLPTDDKCSFRGETLLKAIKEDQEKGLIPCYVVATLGTTGTCAFDNLEELGPICNAHNIWLHVDAAYAGAAFVCPEYRYLMSGVEYTDSFNFNPHKWLLVNFDCSALWVKDSKRLIETFSVNRIYLEHEKQGLVPDYRGDDQLTKELLTRLTAGKKIYVIAATFHEKLIIRFVVGSRFTTEEDIAFAWNEITKQATEVLRSQALPLKEKSQESFKKSLGDIATRIESLNLESKTQKIS